MFISLEQAKEIITPEIAAGLALCSRNAFRAWFTEVSDKARAGCGPSAKAYFINDQMINYAKQIFPPNNTLGVQIVKVHNREQLLVKGKIKIKMKKFNRSMKSVNILTATVFCFNNQLKPPLNSQLSMFPPQDDIAHLMNGYQEDSLKTGMKPFIVCPNGMHNYWVWPLDFITIPMEAQAVLPDTGSGSSGLIPKPVTPKEPSLNGNSEMKGADNNAESKSVQS
jgi:hypothetical protein